MNYLKRKMTSTKAMIFAATMGLIMAVAAPSYGQVRDAAVVAPVLTESAADAPEIELPPEGAEVEKAPETGAEAAPASTEAPAADNPAKEDPLGIGGDIVKALKDGKWLVALGGILLFLVFLLRWGLVALKVKWADTKPGGFLIAFGTSFALALGIAFNAGVGFSWALLLGSASAAWLAAGQHGHIKDVIAWLRGD